MLKRSDEHDGNSPYLESPKKPYVFPRSICNFPRFRALMFTKRARFLVREEGWVKLVHSNMAEHGVTRRGRNCENCREMTACFGTRSGTEGPFSFSETFHRLVIFRYKMEGREFALHRDEDHVSQAHAKCQLVSKRLVKKSLKSTIFFHQFNLSMIKYN